MSRANFYKKQRIDDSQSAVDLQKLSKATDTLLKFCIDHKMDSGKYIESIKKCLISLQEKDIKTAVDHFLEVPLGGNGCFNDWWPPVVYEHENSEYVYGVFIALTAYWSRLMRSSIPDWYIKT